MPCRSQTNFTDNLANLTKAGLHICRLPLRNAISHVIVIPQKYIDKTIALISKLKPAQIDSINLAKIYYNHLSACIICHVSVLKFRILENLRQSLILSIFLSSKYPWT